jgi:CheY-like chemotaxis protein
MDSVVGLRVFLVDDDEDTRALYTFALSEAGAEVRAAADGAEAIKSVVEWLPDVIVSDLVMPGTDARALLRELRSLHPSVQIPAVAVSGRSSAEDRAEAMASGFQAHAAKPLTPQDLISLLLRCASARNT